MKVWAAFGALLFLGASALGCDGLLGINVFDGPGEDAGGPTTSPVDGGRDAAQDAEPGDEDAEPGPVDGGRDAGPGDEDAEDSAVPACTLSALTISAGTLNPVFGPAVLSYTVTSSATSLGVPFTVTPAGPAGCSITVNGAAVVSGEASSPIALGLTSPTVVDVAVTPPGEPATTHYALVVPAVQEAYVKASNTRAAATFGFDAVALSSDGNTLAVGSYGESSAATGINGNQSDTSAPSAGAVYVFARTGTTWTQQAYIKASNTSAAAAFGYSVALSSDGNTLTVGSYNEPSATTGINGNQSDTSASGSGAVYVFARTGITWTQQAYVKASNTRASAEFGYAVALSSDGNTLAVGAAGESSAATGINGNQSDTSASGAGAVYVFARTGSTWIQQAYVKASNTNAVVIAGFGSPVALSSDGNTLAVGSVYESSAATGINGNQSDTSAPSAGAVYVFARTGTTWTQQAYAKASNTRASAWFGSAVALSSDGNTLAVGSIYESSAATGINGNQSDTSASGAGAVYVFERTGLTWTQQAYVKASNTRASCFGSAVALSSDSNTLAVGSMYESSATTGINGNQSNTSASGAGAVYVFSLRGTWTQQAYVKASNTRGSAWFGSAVALSADGNTLAVDSYGESSAATGINGNQGDISATYAGAVYVFR